MKGRTPTGKRRHLVTLTNPGAAVPDGDGGFTQTQTALDPADWWVRIEPATVRDLERVTAGTVLSTASHVVTGPYRSDVNTTTQITHEGRLFSVVGVADPEEMHVETIAICVEVVS